MSMTQALIAYGVVFIILLVPFSALLWTGKVKVDWRRVSRQFRPSDYGFVKEQLFQDSEFWVKVLVATFIAVCIGVALATLILPPGGGWALAAFAASLLLLVLLLQYLLAPR
jgi:hypothetical protein